MTTWPQPRVDQAYRRAVWAWAEHLRGGGTTPWRQWRAAADRAAGSAATSVPDGWTSPGAAQLELARRVALRATHPAPGALAEGPTTPADPAGLPAVVEVILGRSGPGRGLPQQPLPWPGMRGRSFGAPPTDPCDVPDEELVRVGAGTLAELLLRRSGERCPEPVAPRRPLLTRRPAFVLAGAPVTAAVVRRALGAAGHVEGGWSPRVVVLVPPLDRALAEVWSARVQRGAPVRWHGFVARWSHRPELPPAADALGLARFWRDRVGPSNVHVVVMDGTVDALRRAADVLLVRTDLPPPGRSAWHRRRFDPSPELWELTPAAVDVARRVNAVLGVRADPATRQGLLRRLSAVLAAADRRRADAPDRHALTVPGPFQDWARARARRLAADLSAGGYPVHGDPDRIVPRFEGVPTHPGRADALLVVIDACLGLAGGRTDDGGTEER